MKTEAKINKYAHSQNRATFCRIKQEFYSIRKQQIVCLLLQVSIPHKRVEVFLVFHEVFLKSVILSLISVFYFVNGFGLKPFERVLSRFCNFHYVHDI